MPDETAVRTEEKRSFWVLLLLGMGLMAAVDEIVFHQLLSWHHFYDEGSTDAALASDGVLHSLELIAIVAAFFLFADMRRRHTLAGSWAWAGFFVGAGGFQLFDGIVDHKLLELHQIRYDVEILPYDLAWNGAALLLLAIGGVLAWRARNAARPHEAQRRAIHARG